MCLSAACPLQRDGPHQRACPLQRYGCRQRARPLGRRRLPTTLADEVFCDMATVDVTGHLPPDTCTPKNYYRGRLPLAEVTV